MWSQEFLNICVSQTNVNDVMMLLSGALLGWTNYAIIFYSRAIHKSREEKLVVIVYCNGKTHKKLCLEGVVEWLLSFVCPFMPPLVLYTYLSASLIDSCHAINKHEQQWNEHTTTYEFFGGSSNHSPVHVPSLLYLSISSQVSNSLKKFSLLFFS